MSLKELQLAATKAAAKLEEATALVKSIESGETVDKEALKLAKSAVTTAKREHTKANSAVAKETKRIDSEKAKAAKVKEREEAKAKKQAEKEEAAKAKAKEKEANKMPEQNGMKMPKPGTKTRAVWDLCNTKSAALKRPVSRAELLEDVPTEWNINMVKSQYAYWRKFHGVTGRIAAPKPEAEPEKETKK